jgi:hypothetical protein
MCCVWDLPYCAVSLTPEVGRNIIMPQFLVLKLSADPATVGV